MISAHGFLYLDLSLFGFTLKEGSGTAKADSREVILGLGPLPRLKKFMISIEFEMWKRGRKMGLWGLRRGEPMRKVELRESMEDAREGERTVTFFYIKIIHWVFTVPMRNYCRFPTSLYIFRAYAVESFCGFSKIFLKYREGIHYR
jgi:hypothetical protein